MIDAVRFWIATPFFCVAGLFSFIGELIAEGPRSTIKRWREGF